MTSAANEPTRRFGVKDRCIFSTVVLTMEDPCVERGPNLGYNSAATAAATQSVKEFLRATLKLN
jgi:dienelactone hydrolase